MWRFIINYIWDKSIINNIKKKNKKVFSCFSCGGGSSFGYKLAGFDVIGNLEIDKKINETYLKNHNPKYNFNIDIREIINKDFFDWTDEELKSFDLIMSNIPFSLKGEIFSRLLYIDKPFVILCIGMCLGYTNIINIFKDKRLQLIIPNRHISYNGKQSSFSSFYFCYKFLYEKDIEFVDLKNNGVKKKTNKLRKIYNDISN